MNLLLIVVVVVFVVGRHYYVLHGRSLAVLPRHEGARPAPEFLEWHHGVFKG